MFKNFIILVILAFIVYVFGIKPYEIEHKPVQTITQQMSPVIQPTQLPVIQPTLSPTPVFQNNETPIWPYTCFIVTQMIHGENYEEPHMAIDIAFGEDTPVYSPISGYIETYIDEYGNPTVRIWNDIYDIEMLHGNWTGSGEVSQGELIGYESNKGWVYDMQGNLCQTENCGYHTHLNIKMFGKNVDPFTVMPPVPDCSLP